MSTTPKCDNCKQPIKLSKGWYVRAPFIFCSIKCSDAYAVETNTQTSHQPVLLNS